MGTATPGLETAITAIGTEISAIANIGTVFNFEHDREDEMEFLRSQQVVEGDADEGDIDVTFIDLEAEEPIEGPATGENYVIYQIRVRYVIVRVGEADWLKVGRQKIRSIADKLNRNQAVFAIGGQPQLRTPETVTIREYGKILEGGPIFDANTVVGGNLIVPVEARDWA